MPQGEVDSVKIKTMPYSYSKFKGEVADHIVSTISRRDAILDVGAGSGVYCDLLRGHFDRIDALEIFPAYVEMFKLRGKYSEVHIGDVREFDLNQYKYIIMGDVLEHLSYPDALSVLDRINSSGKLVMVAVPYLYEQGTEFGNVHETHLQPDLTPEVMATRYPMLHLLYGDEQYGYYANYTTAD